METDNGNPIVVGQDDGCYWGRLNGEPVRAYNAFRYYRNLGAARSIDSAYRNAYPQFTSKRASSTWFNWSSQWEWCQRALAYDQHVDKIEQEARDADIADMVKAFEMDMIEVRFTAIDISKKLIERGREMLNHPITQVTSADGTTIVKPSRWKQGDIPKFFRVAMQLRAIAHEGIDDELINYMARKKDADAQGPGELDDITTADIQQFIGFIDKALEEHDNATLRPPRECIEG